MIDPAEPSPAGAHPDDVPGAAAPRVMPPMRRRPPAPGDPTPRQARVVAVVGAVLTVLLAAAGLVGLLWAAVSIVHG